MNQFVLTRDGDRWFLVPLGGTRPRYDVTSSMVQNASKVIDGTGSVSDALDALLVLLAGRTHKQTVAATVWVVVHNLGHRPNVQVSDAAGDVRGPDIHHVDDNSYTVTFSTPTAGVARYW